MSPPSATSLLREWFASVGTTQRDFAALLEIREETLSRYLHGRLFPSYVTRAAIAYVTKGRVTPESWGPPPAETDSP